MAEIGFGIWEGLKETARSARESARSALESIRFKAREQREKARTVMDERRAELRARAKYTSSGSSTRETSSPPQTESGGSKTGNVTGFKISA